MEIGFGVLLTPEEEGKKNDLIVKLSKINVKKINTNDEIVNKENNQGNEIDCTIKKEFHTKDNEDWSPNSINSLLNAWQKHNKNETTCSRQNVDRAWEKISEEVNERSESSKKPKNCEQCKIKFKTMQGRYNREKMAKKFNPNEPSSWEWYDTMNTLFTATPYSVNNSMDNKNIKEVNDVASNPPNLITYYDVKDKHVEKRIIEENVPKKSFSIDIREKLQDVNNEQNFGTKFHEDQNMIQYNNSSISPRSPRSPKSLLKVKWRDSNSPPLNFVDKFKEEETSLDNMSHNLKLLDYQDDQKKVLFVNEIKEKLMYNEQSTSNRNRNELNRKCENTLKTFDSCSDNSMSCNESDMMDQDSSTSSPLVMTSKNKFKINKFSDVNSLGLKDGEEAMNRFNVMELSRSINCNYKRTCIESITNNKPNYENKEISKEKVSRVEEHNTQIFDNLRKQDENSTSNVGKGNEQMALNITTTDSEANSTKIISTESPMALITSQNESNCSSKQKRKLCFSSKYRFEKGNRSTHTFIRTLMRATNNIPRIKRKNRSPSHESHVHEPNMAIALMTFGAMIQQLEKNHIVLVERVLNEQSTILNDFVKTLKYNDQIREATIVGLIIRFLLSVFLIGIILYGTSKSTSSWMPFSFQFSSWYEKNNDSYFSQLAWIGCFIIVLLIQLLWTSFKKRPTPTLH